MMSLLFRSYFHLNIDVFDFEKIYANDIFNLQSNKAAIGLRATKRFQ